MAIRFTTLGIVGGLLLALYVALIPNALGSVSRMSSQSTSSPFSDTATSALLPVSGKTIELAILTVTASESFTVNGRLYRIQGEVVEVDSAVLAQIYAVADQYWGRLVNHALRNHETAIVRCLEFFHFNSSWPEMWKSNTETIKFDGMRLGNVAVAADLTWILKNLGGDLGPCLGLTQAVINREFTGDAKNELYPLKQIRAVLVFGENIYQSKNGKITTDYFPVSMYLVYDWEYWRREHGYFTMLYPTPGMRP